MKVGDVANLINFRITEKRTDSGSSFFINASIGSDVSPLNDFPIHTRLRTFWPITDQFPTTFASIKKRRCEVEALDKHLKLQPFGSREEIDSGKFKLERPFKLHHRFVKPVDNGDASSARSKSTPKSNKTFLMAFAGSGLNGSELMPCCDEYDIQYQQLMASSKSKDVGGDDVKIPDLSEHDSKLLEFSTRRGYICSLLNWPEGEKNFTYEDKSKEVKTLIRLDAYVVSWGDPRCDQFKDYKNPMSIREMNPSNGLCENPNSKEGEEYLYYDFDRCLYRVTLWGRDIQGLGPTEPTDVFKLLSCYQVPVDMILTPNEKDSLENTCNADIEKKRMVKKTDGVDLEKMKESIGGDKQKELDYLEEREKARWHTVSKDKYVSFKMDVESFYEQTKDGVIEQSVLMASWRISELLIEAGVRLSPNLASEQLKEIAQQKLMSNVPNNVNSIGVENANGVVYLNEGLTTVSRLGNDYTYYALVCYSEKARIPSIALKRNQELKDIVERSKDPSLTCDQLDEINQEFIKNNNGHIYYYALNPKVLEKSAILAKNTLKSRMESTWSIVTTEVGSDSLKSDNDDNKDQVVESSGSSGFTGFAFKDSEEKNTEESLIINGDSGQENEPLEPSFCFGKSPKNNNKRSFGESGGNGALSDMFGTPRESLNQIEDEGEPPKKKRKTKGNSLKPHARKGKK